MKIISPHPIAFIRSGLLIAFALTIGPATPWSASPPASAEVPERIQVQVGHSYKNDVSPPLRDMQIIFPSGPKSQQEALREAAMNPRVPMPEHVDGPDPVVDRGILGLLSPDAMPRGFGTSLAP